MCSVENCSNKVNARGLCSNHYRAWRKFGNPLGVSPRWEARLVTHCTVEGCDKPKKAKGLCSMHCQRVRRHNDPNTVIRRERKPRAIVNKKDRYFVVQANGHPNGNKAGRILEHRLIMAEHIGRALLVDETVHHKNGDRQDNRLENLELWSGKQPSGQRVEDKIQYAIEILETYAPHMLQNKGVDSNSALC
jgi:hypothetical protein